ncbi:hypothetical protein O5O45_08505 [Hahella aquimaris]|uniref:hypothetical protein n=1 Tax=Hahella sp. HNIBRBA332 TaxID=3015983 RepID=UPI00273C224A|nr:hypothetical protein [Hahella sp. HNIBRBA332]WLQ15954.1 hypothetical protein O5O45_08505 [Hahella sp. HNIBRBA332]
MSEEFHKVISKRSLGDPIIYRSKLISLDHKNLNGKIENLSSNATSIIHFENNQTFHKAKEYLGTEEIMIFTGCPMIEYGAFDPKAGDIYFLDLHNG